MHLVILGVSLGLLILLTVNLGQHAYLTHEQYFIETGLLSWAQPTFLDKLSFSLLVCYMLPLSSYSHLKCVNK